MTSLKAGGQLFLAVALVLGGGDPAHGARPKSTLDMGILLSTPITHVDTDGDGQVDLVREFDGNGVLQRLEWNSPDRGRSWMRIWYRQPRGREEERVLEYHRKGALVSLLKNIMGARGERLSRERLHYEGRAPHRLVRELFLRDVRVIQDYKFVRGAWVADGQARNLRDVLYLNERGEALAGEYESCGVWGSGWGMEDPCEKANASLAKNLGVLTPDAIRYMTECSYDEKIGSVYREWLLRTPQGLEIDLSSCSTEGAVQAIKKSAKSLEQSLSCLYSVAPSFAMGAYLGIAGCAEGKALRIHCGNSANPDNWYGMGCSQLINADFCSGGSGHAGSGATYSAGLKTIILTAYDPTVKPVRNESDQELLDSALFHEVLHNAENHDGMHGDEQHNDQGAPVGSPDDWVYACQSLCSPSHYRFSYLSRERCEACAEAGDGDVSVCGRLPPEAVSARIKGISAMDRCIDGIRRNLTPDELLLACKALYDSPAMPDGSLAYRSDARSIYDVCMLDPAHASEGREKWISCIQDSRKKHQKVMADEIFSSPGASTWMGNLSVFRLDEEGRPGFDGVLDVERKEELKLLIEAGAAAICRGEQSSPDARLVGKLENEAARIGLSDEDPTVGKFLGVLKSTPSTERKSACRGLLL